MVALLLSRETSEASRERLALGFAGALLNDPKPWYPKRGVQWPSWLPDSPEGADEGQLKAGHELRAEQERRDTRNTGRLLDLVWALRTCQRAYERTQDPHARTMLGELGRIVRDEWRIREPIPPDDLDRWALRKVSNRSACPVSWRRGRR